MRAIRCLVAAVLAAGIVTMVAAQPGGRQPGFGGFGQAEVYTLVLTNTALQEEVKVTDAQKEKFKTIAEKRDEMTKKAGEGLKEKFAEAKDDKDKFQELFQSMQKDFAKVNEDVRKMTDEVLTAEQKKRLKQIHVQQLGFRVFDDPDAKREGKGGKGGFGGGFGGFGGTSEADKAVMKEVQTALKLSDSQKSTIKGLTADYAKERGELYKDAGISPFPGFGKGGKDDPEKRAAVEKKVEKVSQEVWGKIEEAMEAEQKKTWKEFRGEPFDLAKLRTQRQPRKD